MEYTQSITLASTCRSKVKVQKALSYYLYIQEIFEYKNGFQQNHIYNPANILQGHIHCYIVEAHPNDNVQFRSHE